MHNLWENVTCNWTKTIEKQYDEIGDIFFRAKVLISVPRIYAHHKENLHDMEALIIALRVKTKAKKPN